jgi:hypothetical protein
MAPSPASPDSVTNCRRFIGRVRGKVYRTRTESCGNPVERFDGDGAIQPALLFAVQPV